MGQKVARVGDIGVGVCPNHSSPVIYTTTFRTGSPSTTIDGQAACYVGTIGTSTCGHDTTALTGSSVGITSGKGFHRVGDTGQNFGTYTVTTGSPTTTSD